MYNIYLLYELKISWFAYEVLLEPGFMNLALLYEYFHPHSLYLQVPGGGRGDVVTGIKKVLDSSFVYETIFCL